MQSPYTCIHPNLPLGKDARMIMWSSEPTVRMKFSLFVLFLSCWNIVSAQSTIPVSSTGIGDIKINMTLADVEKIIGNTIDIPLHTEESYAFDSVQVNYKGIVLDLAFYTAGDDENGKPKKMVYGLSASHQSLQTRSGFTLGSDKFDIVKKLDGMYLHLQPDWRMEEKSDKAKYSVLILTDGENGTQLMMYFENNKLTGFHLTIHEGC